MKKLVILTVALLTGTFSGLAETGSAETRPFYGYGYGKSFIFVENGVTFSVYPDGEFDFYIDRYANIGGHVDLGGVGITFNSGYDYNPYVQYDDYGAVIQVENVPIYYDYYGRVEQIGDVRIRYRNNRVFRVGGMHVYYTPAGYFDYYTGYINVYNRYYVYRPWHAYFARPALNFCLVYNYPYRRYYSPVRYTYYRPYRLNHRRVFATVGKPYTYRNGWNRRSKIYRNDDRVAARQYRHRKGDSYRTDRDRGRSQFDERSRRGSGGKQGIARSDYKRGTTNARSQSRSQVQRRTDGQRSNLRQTQVVKRSSDGNRTTVKKRSVSTSPKRTVTRKSTTVKKPAARSIKREISGNRTVANRSKTVKRATPQKRSSSVNRSATQKRSTVSRSSSVKRSAPQMRSTVSRSSSVNRSSAGTVKRSSGSSKRTQVASRSSRTAPKARSTQSRSSRSGKANTRSGKRY